MGNYNVLSKSISKVTVIEGEVEELTLEEINDRLGICQKVIDTSVEPYEIEVRNAEEMLAATVAEIDTEISEREEELQKQVESDLSKLKETFNLEIQEACERYSENVKSLKTAAEATAKDICMFKENGISVVNSKLDRARKALDALKKEKAQAIQEKEQLMNLKNIIEAEIAKQMAITASAISYVDAQQPQVIYATQNAPTQNKLKF